MRRIQGWEKRFAAYLLARQDLPFVWGHNDCASFCVGAVREITGETIWDIQWTTALQAERASEEAGGPQAAWTSALGHPGQNWKSIRRGDVAMVEMQGRRVVTMCTGQSLCGPGPKGLEHLPLDRAIFGWKVG